MLSSREFLYVAKDAPAELKFQIARAKSIGVLGSKIAVSPISRSQIELLRRFLGFQAKNGTLSAQGALKELPVMSGSGLQQ
jgi:hypothetical protein